MKDSTKRIPKNIAELAEISGKVIRYYRSNRLRPTLKMLAENILLLFRKWFRFGFDRPLVPPAAGKPVLIVTHDLGGGAEKYAIMLRESLVKSGVPVIVLKNTVFNAKPVFYTAAVYDGDRCRRWYYSSAASWIGNTAGIRFQSVYSNCLIKFDSLYQWIDYLKTFDDLVLPIHDFHAVCPSYNLLDYQNQYCGFRHDCVACMRKNCDCHDIDINLWRSKWGELIRAARSIISFSESSREIYCIKYPEARDKIKVIPHSMAYFKIPAPVALPPSPMRLAVIGNISSIAKGSLIVEELARKMAPEQLLILGEYSGKIQKNMIVTGRFTWETLPGRMLKYKINILLLPTVCPETFSYLTSEVILARYPLVCFNLDVQAQKVGAYPLGATCGKIDAGHLYETAAQLYQKIFSAADNN